MSQPADLAQRVYRLEAELKQQRTELRLFIAAQTETAADTLDARRLAAAADRDVAGIESKITAQTRLIEAIRETQVEQGAQIAEIREGIGTLVGMLNRLIGDAG